MDYRIELSAEADCKAIDKLLVATAWHAEPEGDGTGSAWHNVVAEAVQEHELEGRFQAFLKEHPALFADEDGGKATL